MPGLTLTLATGGTAYNLLNLIKAVSGYANTHPTVRELTLLGDPGNGGGFVYEGGSDVTSANYGIRLKADESHTFRSTLNDVSLQSMWVVGSGNNLKLHADWEEY